MVKTIIIKVFLMLSFFCSVCLAKAQQKTPVIVGFADFPPYSIEVGFTTYPAHTPSCPVAKKIGHGIDVDFVEAVMQEAGIKYDVQFYPQARLNLLLKHKKVDITGSLFLSDDQGAFRYIQYDIGGATTFYALNEVAPLVQSFSGIKSYTLGVVRNEFFHDDALNSWSRSKNQDKVIIANDYDHLFHMLAKKRVDIIATNDVLGAFLSAQKSLSHISLAPYRIPYGTDPKKDGIYIGTQGNFPDQDFEKLKRATETLLAENLLACIKERYGVSSN